MRTKTTTITIYKFDELSEKAKEKFLDKARDVVKVAWNSWCKDLREGKSPSIRDFLDEIECSYMKELSDEYYAFDEEDARDLAEANGFEFLEDGTIYYGK